jgi:hypothetical protein
MRRSKPASATRLAAAVAVAAALAGICTHAFTAGAAIRTRTTCDAANPFDTAPDEIALQACLDDYDDVLLQPSHLRAYVGYIVNDTLKLKRRGALLSTTDNPRKATIVAGRDLTSSMLRASAVDDFEISFVRFDGNRENRAVRDKPCDAGHNYRNVELTGNGFQVRYVESFGAVCGSAMTIGGSATFQIYGSWFYDNGRQPEEAGNISGLWADGLTVFRCPGSTIRDNHFWDNTDVDLGVNGGPACSVYRNIITHTSKYAFAGLVVGDPTNAGGEFSANVISSGYNLLGFGIIVGCHPWSQCGGGYASNVDVYDNSVTGAVVNLAVDGLNGGSIRDNRLSMPQGARVLNCPGAANYTIGHMLNARVQPGYIIRFFDFGSDCL